MQGSSVAGWLVRGGKKENQSGCQNESFLLVSIQLEICKGGCDPIIENSERNYPPEESPLYVCIFQTATQKAKVCKASSSEILYTLYLSY